MNDLTPIRRKLAALRRRISAALALDGASRMALGLLGAVALSFLLDRVFKLETAARAVLLVAGLALLGWIAWRFLVRRLRAVPGEDPLAVAVERAFPHLGDRLISAIQLGREPDPERWGMSPQLVEDVVKDAVGPALQVPFRRVLATGRVLRHAALGLLALGLLALGAAADPESAGIWFRRNVLLRDVRWPQRTHLQVDPSRFPDGVARVVRGEDLVVTAWSTGEVDPERVTILFTDSEGASGHATMKADVENRTYRHEFREIAFPLVFHLEGGDEVTPEYRVELMAPPEATDVEVEVGFPPYAGREPRPVDLSQGDPEMLRGGFVLVRGRSTKPLERAQLVLGAAEEQAAEATLVGGDRFEVTFAPQETTLAGIRLRDRDGLSNPSLSPRFLVRVMDDRAPRVNLRKEGIGTMVVEGAVLPWVVRVRDDVKVVSGRIEALKGAGDRQAPEPVVLPLDPAALGGESAEIQGRIEISTLQAPAGSFLTFHAYATDNAEPEAHEGRSDPVTVKVVTLEELFSELLRRQQEQRRLFEELIQREKRLRESFLDLRDHPPSDPAEVRVHLESEAQSQREIARRVRTIERAMAEILDEMLNNRIYDPARITELRNAVVRGMENLRENVMEGHASMLDDSAKRAPTLALQGDDGKGIGDGYDRVLRAMEAVLEKMVKVEGFTEIVERMRAILDLHAEVREETRRKYEAGLREIFEDED